MTNQEFRELKFLMEHTRDANILLTKLLSDNCYNVRYCKIEQKDTDKDGEFYFYTWKLDWQMKDPDGNEHDCFNCVCWELK